LEVQSKELASVKSKKQVVILGSLEESDERLTTEKPWLWQCDAAIRDAG
jgi:hypothetical protein